MLKLIKLFFINMFFLSSCISTQAYWEKKDYQPVKSGIVFYDQTPSLFDKTAVDQRLQDAKNKMMQFCNPEKPSIVSEQLAEKVIGQYTDYSSSHHNPSSGWYSRKSSEKDGSTRKESYFYSSPVSFSSGQATSINITQNRVYITFQCQ